MTDADTRELGFLGKLVIALAVVLIVAGALWHGVTLGTFVRLWRDLVDWPDGPMSFRFILQPSMAAIATIRDGV